MLAELKEIIKDEASLLEVLAEVGSREFPLPEMTKKCIAGYSKSLWVNDSLYLGSIEQIMN